MEDLPWSVQLLFSKLGLKDSFFLSHLDPKHMIIRLNEEADFNRLWLREVWFFYGYPMRTFRWMPDIRLDAESSIALIWISIPNLPFFLFNKQGLFSMGSILGKPLTMDTATAEFTRPNVA